MAVKRKTRRHATETAAQNEERCRARAVARRAHITLYLMCSLEPGHDSKHYDWYEQVAWDRSDETPDADTDAGTQPRPGSTPAARKSTPTGGATPCAHGSPPNAMSRSSRS